MTTFIEPDNDPAQDLLRFLVLSVLGLLALTALMFSLC